MRKPMPVGKSDFKEIIEQNSYFVDKTLLIKEIIDKNSKVTLFARPRRFGKTLALHMLRYYFDIENAAKNQTLFANLAISQAGDRYVKEQGRYPIVFLTLKDLKTNTWEDCYHSLCDLMLDLYDAHQELADSAALTEAEKKYYQSIIDQTADRTDYATALKKIIVFLHKHYGTKPILLIDEYDTPVQSGYISGYYDQIVDFIRFWLSGALKDNTHLNFAVLTGILRIAKESIFSGLNNIDVNTMLDTAYSQYFGFTQEEVDQIAQNYACADKLPEIREWYDGYNFGGREIYNPWSVINYFKDHCQAAPYWLNTSSNDIVKILIERSTVEVKENLQKLFQGKAIEAQVDDVVVYPEIFKSADAMYTMLLMTGYLKVISTRKLNAFFKIYELGIPNLEIQAVYQKEVLNHIASGITSMDMISMLSDLLTGNVAGFEKGLNRLLIKMVSFYDGKMNKEGFYHGLMLGMTALLIENYYIKSNRESGYGRFDLAIYPKGTEKNAVIMEFKAGKTIEELEELAERAACQIEEKQYIAEFKERGELVIQKYGIAFYGKEVRIKKSESV